MTGFDGASTQTPEHALAALFEVVRSMLAAGAAGAAGAPGGDGLAGTPLGAFGEALRPIAGNLERAYGGLADAFGLAPLRALDGAGRNLALAAVVHREAQSEYLQIVAGALAQGAAALTTTLAEMAARGESVESLLALTRLWARTTDAAMHETMQSPRALDATSRLLRASANARREQQRVVAVLSEALNVPTRAEVDEAYREIQELKREVRRLRKAVDEAEAAPPAPTAPKSGRPARKTPARRSPRTKAA